MTMRATRAMAATSSAWKIAVVVAVVSAILLAGEVRAAEDYYKTLGVSRSASAAQIKRAYRRLAVEYHPDKNQDDPDATSKFAKINNAYEALSDPEKRKLYDRYGEEGLQRNQRSGGGGGGGDPFDVFNSFFGGGFGGFGGGRFNQQQGEPETPKGADVVIDLDW